MVATVDETALIQALRNGDETAFAMLVDQHTPAMLRVARGYVPSAEIAEEVVQEAWIALIKGIGKFEGRSSLRTWLFTVMINIAKLRGVHRYHGRPGPVPPWFRSVARALEGGRGAIRVPGNTGGFAAGHRTHGTRTSRIGEAARASAHGGDLA